MKLQANLSLVQARLAADHLQGPNWYQKARNKLIEMLGCSWAPPRVEFHLTDASDYGGVLWFTCDRAEFQLTKGKVRWRDLTFYGLKPEASPGCPPLSTQTICALCGQPKPADQSCICFDNHCQ